MLVATHSKLLPKNVLFSLDFDEVAWGAITAKRLAFTRAVIVQEFRRTVTANVTHFH